MARRKNNGLPLAHYQQVADAYLEITLRDGFRGVRPKMAERFGSNVNTVSSQVRKARDLGLLEPYRARQCWRCGQPVPRRGNELEALETLAGDHALLVRRLALEAEQNGHTGVSGTFRAVAGHFERAAEALARYTASQINPAMRGTS